MKLINSKKDIERVEFDSDNDFISPCWEVKIDKERNELVFLVDGQEKLAHSLSTIDVSLLTLPRISELIGLLREGNIKALRKLLKAGK